MIFIVFMTMAGFTGGTHMHTCTYAHYNKYNECLNNATFLQLNFRIKFGITELYAELTQDTCFSFALSHL